MTRAQPDADAIRAGLESVSDPCLAAAGLTGSVVALGLVRSITVTDDKIIVTLLLTEVGCPFAHRLMAAVDDRVRALAPGYEVEMAIDWSETWTEGHMAPMLAADLAGARTRLASLKAHIRAAQTGSQGRGSLPMMR